MTTSEYLKNNTQQYHQEIETLMNSKKIFEPNYSREDYYEFLMVQFLFLALFEEKVHQLLSIDYGNLLQLDLRRKLQVLKSELEENGQTADDNNQLITAKISISQALGILYVMEGSTLGGNVIRKALQKNPSFVDYEFKYLSMYGPAVGTFWKQLTTLLDQLNETRDEILSGTVLAYENLIAIAKKIKKPIAIL